MAIQAAQAAVFAGRPLISAFKPSKTMLNRFPLFSILSNSYSSDTEKQLVLEVKEKLGREYSTLPVGKNGRDDEEMILWFLKDRRFCIEETISKLTKAIIWRQQFNISELTEESLKTIAATGKAYLHESLDVSGRPVIIVVASKHFAKMHDPIEDEKLCAFLIEKALKKLQPGEEQILGIFDLRGFGVENADVRFLGFIFDAFYCYYPRRLGEVLFVDAPFVFQPIWQMAKPLLKSYASLVKFCSANDVRRNYFTSDTLPSTFKE